MTQSLRKKTAALVIAVLVSMVAMGLLLANVQSSLTLSSYDEEFAQSAAKLPELLADAESESDQNTSTYDAIYQSKAASVAFMAQNNVGFEATDAKMREYAELLEVDNVLVVSKDGTVRARATSTKADFSRDRFNQLRTVFDDGEPSDSVEIDLSDEDWSKRYYAARIDDETMVVVEQDPQELKDLIATADSASSVLKNITVGQNGYVFAVSATDYLVTYHPDDELMGTDALDDGIDVADLTDGSRFNVQLKGTELYCGVTQVDDTYYVFAVPTAELANSRVITVGVILFSFFVVMLSVVLYGVFVMREDAEEGKAENTTKLGRFTYNQTVGKKALALSVVGLVVIVAVAFYMQTLFALSSQTVANDSRLEQINATIKENSEKEAELREQYNTRYLSKARVAAYIVDENPGLATRDKLGELADVLQIKAIYVFDGDGVMTASSTAIRSYKLSDDPEEKSYEFRVVLNGEDELVQELSTNDTTGEAEQFIGVATHDDSGYADGLVQIAVRPQRLENLLASVKIDHVLDGVKVGSEGFAFAVSKADGTIAYHPNEKLVGKAATDAGLTESQLKDGFSNYVTMGGQTTFASCSESDDYYLFVAGPEGELMAERAPLAGLAGGVAAVCLIFVFCVLTLSAGADPEVEAAAEAVASGAVAGDPAARMVDVTLADGSVKKTESAMSRWLNRSFSWGEKTAEQKLGTVLRALLGVLAFVVFLATVFKDAFFERGSVFAYILGGSWEHGVNIFAITASIMYACVAITVASVAEALLRLLSRELGARGETICRLLRSGVKYGTAIFMLYWCLGVLGVDTATLLASAGIITLAISLGAKDIVNDVMSGLFIIFEGEFRVGDIIQVGSNTGTVMEIGVRTTKIKDGNDDVLVIRNSSISNVTNKTKMNSYAKVDVVLPLGESLTYVENVLREELPNIRRRVPVIVDGPFYKGVVELTDELMTIRIVAACTEGDRGALERTLKRETSLALARHDVAPFQVVYEHPEEIEKPTVKEQIDEIRADIFNKQQQDAAAELGNEGAELPPQE